MRSLLLSCGFVLAACGPLKLDPAPGDAGAKPRVDASMSDAGELPDDDAASAGPPTVTITTPANGAMLTDSDRTLRIEGTSSDDRGVASVNVRIGKNQPLVALTADNFRSWWIESPVPAGAFTVEAVARDIDGELSTPVSVSVLRASLANDDGAPTIGIDEPADGSSPLHTLALVRGHATDDRGVVSIDVYRREAGVDQLLVDREVATSDFFASWSRLVPLLPGELNELTFVAKDEGGREARTTLKLLGRAERDTTPPALTIKAPGEGEHLNGTQLTVTGSATDNKDVSTVKVRIGRTLPGSSDVQYGEYVAATKDNAFDPFSVGIAIPVGAFQLEVRAIDSSGLATSVKLNLVNDFLPTYADEVAIPLRLPSTAAKTPLNFVLDKAGVNEVFTEQIQRDTLLLELDTTTLVTSAVEQIKTSCGVLWRENNADPRHNCAATDYGKNQSPPVSWQLSPEYSMVRLLTMTPANVKVDGTSLQALKDLANGLSGLGLISSFNQILAETMGIPVTQEIVSTASVTKALQDFWMSTHPEVLPGAKLPITLFDSMNDLAPLAQRFGAKGGHPGLLDPAFPPHSQILTPQFQMKLAATSNLNWLDGVDASGKTGTPAKEYLAQVIDTAGPTFDDVLEFDFIDPAKFDVVGLVDSPTVDMRMLLRENSTFVRSCVAENATCRNNLPTAPAAGYVWSNPRHQIEAVVTDAAFLQYRTRQNYAKDYNFLVNLARVTVGNGGNPAGWATFQTFAGLGDPPPDQFLWETILEVGQVALHNFSNMTVPEGQVNVAFTLRNVPVGLTADGIRSAMRPKLQEQRAKLSDMLLGDYDKNNGAVDFFYRRGADGAAYLFFVASGDPLPTPYNYPTPGFFMEPELTTKLSKLQIDGSGDSSHEKLKLAPGESTVYLRDNAGAVYRLRIVVPQVAVADINQIDVFVSKKVR